MSTERKNHDKKEHRHHDGCMDKKDEGEANKSGEPDNRYFYDVSEYLLISVTIG